MQTLQTASKSYELDAEAIKSSFHVPLASLARLSAETEYQSKKLSQLRFSTRG